MTQHLTHLLMLVLPLAVFAGLMGLEWRRSSGKPLAAPLRLAALLTTAAGGVHGAVAAHHARESAVLGWAMALMCLAQVTWAIWLLFSPARRVVEVGVLGNLGVVVLWAWTRAVGIPFGIAGGLRQAVGTWDVTSTLLEVGAVLSALLWVERRSARPLAVASPGRVGIPG